MNDDKETGKNQANYQLGSTQQQQNQITPQPQQTMQFYNPNIPQGAQPQQQIAYYPVALNPQQQPIRHQPQYVQYQMQQPQQVFQQQQRQPQQLPQQQVSYMPVHNAQPLAQMQMPQQVQFQNQYNQNQPAFLDQRCFNLVKAKKGVKRWGKCQIYSSYVLIFLNAMSLIQNVFLIFTAGSWSTIPVETQNGQSYTVEIGEGGIIMLSLLKVIVNIMLIKLGIFALKTFKPIIKDIHKQEVQGIFHQSGELGSQQYGSVERKSKSIKQYRRKFIKIMIAGLVITFVGCLYARCYFMTIADKFIDAEYDNQQSQGQVNPNDQNGQFNYPPPPPPNSNDSNFGGDNNDQQFQPMPAPWQQGFMNGVNQLHHGQEKGGEHHKNGKHHKKSASWTVQFDNFDMRGMSKEDAKNAAHSMINIVVLGIFTYSICIYGCIGGCCLFSINKAKNYQKLSETYSANLQPAIAQGLSINGFQQVPNSDVSLDTEAQNNIIPRGVVIN